MIARGTQKKELCFAVLHRDPCRRAVRRGSLFETAAVDGCGGQATLEDIGIVVVRDEGKGMALNTPG